MNMISTTITFLRKGRWYGILSLSVCVGPLTSWLNHGDSFNIQRPVLISTAEVSCSSNGLVGVCPVKLTDFALLVIQDTLFASLSVPRAARFKDGLVVKCSECLTITLLHQLCIN
jgi:hypothetical protein